VLILHGILAALAVGASALGRQGRQLPAARGLSAASASLVIALGAAAVDIVLGADPSRAIGIAVPLLVFLGSAMSLAALAERSGLCDRAADRLARAAGGRGWALYALVCAACAGCTAVVSLDGAVVLMIPVVLALHRRYAAPFAPLFLGVVAVANPVSIAVPQGNPTNLVVMARLGLSPAAFIAHLALPGIAAAAVGAAGVALQERGALADRYWVPPAARSPWTAAERRAAAALAVAALVACGCPLAGLAPWWPFAGVAAAALAVERRLGGAVRLMMPWQVTVRVAALVVVIAALPLPPLTGGLLGIPALLAVAAGVGTVAAVVNNLPASVWAASLMTAGPTAFAASIGLGIGAMATAHGSVATVVAADLSGGARDLVSARRLAPLAAAGVVVACAVLAVSL
jgi:arsenical pump membrane protein